MLSVVFSINSDDAPQAPIRPNSLKNMYFTRCPIDFDAFGEAFIQNHIHWWQKKFFRCPIKSYLSRSWILMHLATYTQEREDEE